MALSIDGRNMKANYLAGLSYLTGRQENEPAIRHLQKALEAAREANDSIKDDIWRELAKAKYSQWQMESSLRQHVLDDLQSDLSASIGISAGQQVCWIIPLGISRIHMGDMSNVKHLDPIGDHVRRRRGAGH